MNNTNAEVIFMEDMGGNILSVAVNRRWFHPRTVVKTSALSQTFLFPGLAFSEDV